MLYPLFLSILRDPSGSLKVLLSVFGYFQLQNWDFGGFFWNTMGIPHSCYVIARRFCHSLRDSLQDSLRDSLRDSRRNGMYQRMRFGVSHRV